MFTYKEGDEASYFVISEDFGGDAADVDPSGAGTSKESPMVLSSIGWTTEASASEGEAYIRPSSAKIFSMEPGGISVTVEEVQRETVAEAVEAVSPLGNTLISSKQFSLDIRYALFQQSLFTGVPLLGASTSRGPADLPEGIRSETSTSAATDVAALDALYHDLPSYQSEPAGGVKDAEETVATELISLPAGSVGEMPVVSLTLPILKTTGLKVITSPTSPMLVVEPVLPEIVTSPTSIVASVLVSMRTPLRSPVIPRLSPASASVISSTIMIVKRVEALS